MNIITACKDEKLFGHFFEDLTTWRPWLTAAKAMFGLPITSDEERALVKQCTGREVEDLPRNPTTCLFLCGRRSGKSRFIAVASAYLALFNKAKVAKGETLVLPVISPSRFQSTLIFKYLTELFEGSDLLRAEVAERKDSEKIFTLKNGVSIVILTGDHRTVRGPSLVACALDETCFFGTNTESPKEASEIVQAIRPALLTTKGKLLAISSKGPCKGWAWTIWKKNYGGNKGLPGYSPRATALVWDAPSQVMNPTLSEKDIAELIAEDPVAGRQEIQNYWKEDVSAFLPREMIEALVVPGRSSLKFNPQWDYRAGVDLSGGRHDSASLCIIHKDGKKVVQDFSKEWKAPFNPFTVVAEIALILARWGLHTVTGDAYAGSWPQSSFSDHRVIYRPAKASKSDLYKEMLPILCAGKESIELLDVPTQTNQLANLERRARTTGDIIDHPSIGSDDVANALAVACSLANVATVRIGGMRFTPKDPVRQEDREISVNRRLMARIITVHK